MIWTTLSVLMCLALAIKLVFFTDQHRAESRFFYRLILFFSAVYAGKQVIWFVYYPEQPTNPVIFVLHAAMFIGALIIKPCHLPWNQCK
jgi:hypothetical protein